MDKYSEILEKLRTRVPNLKEEVLAFMKSSISDLELDIINKKFGNRFGSAVEVKISLLTYLDRYQIFSGDEHDAVVKAMASSTINDEQVWEEPKKVLN